jgi:hypothetical protein
MWFWQILVNHFSLNTITDGLKTTANELETITITALVIGKSRMN